MQGGGGTGEVDRLAVIRAALEVIADAEEVRFDDDERALIVAVFAAALGHDSDEMAASASQLASLLNATDRSEEAVELYRRVLRIRQEQFGSDHPTVVSTLHNLALACDAAGRAEEAQILWDEARAALEATKQATP